MTQALAPTRQRFWLVFLLFLHTVNTYIDRACISSAKSQIQDDISGLTDERMGLVFGIFAVGYALFQIPAGWFSDRAGPRYALTIVVVVWSIFTAMTGAVFTAISLLVVRFLFGVGEAGAYPGATRALYSWLPANERGAGQGIFHSGARIGAAVSLVAMPMLIDAIGWRMTFVANGGVGFVWAAIWWFWFRNEPSEHSSTNDAERELIRSGIEDEEAADNSQISYFQIVTSRNVLLAMVQYVASNITFFISITWFSPYLKDNWGEGVAKFSAIPLLAGAVALWLSGFLVTFLDTRGFKSLSRRLPAMIGFGLGTLGMLLCIRFAQVESAWPIIFCYSLAVFGVEMTLSPSWSFCMDIGGTRSGAVSAAMNMVGNLGSAFGAILFPIFMASVTIPILAPETGTAGPFFVFAASLNLIACICWLFMDPKRVLQPVSDRALMIRKVLFGIAILFIAFLVIYVKLLR